MKQFFNFLNEAKQSQASMQAKRLGLKGDGHGGWYDAQGEFVAKTEKGELKFYNQGQRVGQRDLPQQRTQASQEVASTQVTPTAPQPASGAEAEKPAKEGGESVTLVFGRFNPPTVGHQKLLNSASGASTGSELRIYPSRTQDPKKNPLDPSTKIEYMKKMFPKYEESIIDDENMKTIFDVLKTADEDGFSDVTIVVGADRLGEFKNLANKYNGELYTFDSINVVSAGERDADSEGVEGMSASKMRKAAADDDFQTFRSGIPKSLDEKETKKLFAAVRNGMKITAKESYQLWQIAPKCDFKTLRENYYLKNIFKMGDFVESLNTGLIGKVIRRGANHLICVTNEGLMFKSWIRDLMEYNEVKVDKKMRVPGKPNTLVGTSGYFKYASDMTPGFEKGEKTNLQPGAKPYSGYKTSSIREFINKYKKN
jgi:hypothetical protein